MITIKNTEVFGWEAAIRGCRNPMNSWDRADSYYTYIENPETGNRAKFEFFMGNNDHELAMRLAKSGSTHAKYRRMIVVYADITAPLYWWKEFDTYRMGVEKNSCSTMHKIQAKEFTPEDFSREHLMTVEDYHDDLPTPKENEIRIVGDFNLALEATVHALNDARELYLETKDKRFWWQMIQLLPSSYNQKRTVMMSYEALSSMYRDRKDHKLDEWREFCAWVKNLPYSEIITLEEENAPENSSQN